MTMGRTSFLGTFFGTVNSSSSDEKAALLDPGPLYRFPKKKINHMSTTSKKKVVRKDETSNFLHEKPRGRNQGGGNFGSSHTFIISPVIISKSLTIIFFTFKVGLGSIMAS
jgi:hypothetical protein